MDVRAKVEELLAIDAQVATLDARRKRLRAELHDEALTRYHDEGAAPSWKAKGLGTVSLACPDPSPTVVNDAAFVSWVAAHAPSEVVPTVRPAFVKSLTASAHRLDDGRLVTGDGEVIPGMTVVDREPYLTVRLDPAAKTALLSAALDSQETPR